VDNSLTTDNTTYAELFDEWVEWTWGYICW
jgi:hypothetical protein